jgi:hypothetical protein
MSDNDYLASLKRQLQLIRISQRLYNRSMGDLGYDFLDKFLMFHNTVARSLPVYQVVDRIGGPDYKKGVEKICEKLVTELNKYTFTTDYLDELERILQ